MEISRDLIGCIILIVALGWFGLIWKTKEKLLVIPLILTIYCYTLMLILTNANAKYEMGYYPDEEHYKLGLDIDKEGNFKYIGDNFTVKETKVDLSKAIISGRIDTIGFHNRYKKYVKVGGLKVYWDTYEDVFILSKYSAIQLGMWEATGAPDEEQFKIATGADADKLLEEQNK